MNLYFNGPQYTVPVACRLVRADDDFFNQYDRQMIINQIDLAERTKGVAILVYNTTDLRREYFTENQRRYGLGDEFKIVDPKSLTKGGNMHIGSETIKAMSGLLKELIDDNAKKINEAFLKSDDDSLKISLGIDVGVSEKVPGALDVDATIAFTTEKVKQKVTKRVNESQAELPLKEKDKK